MRIADRGGPPASGLVDGAAFHRVSVLTIVTTSLELRLVSYIQSSDHRLVRTVTREGLKNRLTVLNFLKPSGFYTYHHV
jgi:hypothetical protein